MKSIGIDIGKRRCIVCTMDRNGTVLEETGYENTYAAATAFARKARREYGKCQAVCESTGNLWIKAYEAFEDRGIPIELANPMKVRAIAEASVKIDKVDARTLAHLLRTSLIARCHVAERGVRGVRQLLREGNNLVKARTQTINRLHNLLGRYDLNPKDFAQDIWRERALKALDSKSLADPNGDYVLHRYVRGIRHHNAELSLLEKKIAGHASASEDARILMRMTGIDYFAAMLLASEIDGIGRFASPKKLLPSCLPCKRGCRGVGVLVSSLLQDGSVPVHGADYASSFSDVDSYAFHFLTSFFHLRQAGSCSHLSGIVRPTNESSSDCPIHCAGLMGHDPIGVNLPRTVRGRMLSYFHCGHYYASPYYGHHSNSIFP